MIKPLNLLKTYSYPGYQFRFDIMLDNRSAKETIHYAALTVLKWLRDKIDEETYPVELQSVEPDQYLQTTDDTFFSYHFNKSYSLDITALLSQGIWAMRLQSVDEGSKDRPAVIGRFLSTDISFHEKDGQWVECGIQINVIDPVDAERLPNAFRPAIVRTFLLNQQLTMRQVDTISHSKLWEIMNEADLVHLKSLINSTDCYLPVAVFTEIPDKQDVRSLVKKLDQELGLETSSDSFMKRIERIKGIPKTIQLLEPLMPFDAQEFAHKTYGYGRTVLVHGLVFDVFRDWIKRDYEKNINPGDVLILTPKNHGRKCRITRYNPNDEKYQRDQDFVSILSDVLAYSGQHDISFSNIVFEEEARNIEYQERIKQIHISEQELSAGDLEELFDKQARLIEEKDERIRDLTSQYHMMERLYSNAVRQNTVNDSEWMVDDKIIAYPKDPIGVALVFETIFGDKLAFTDRCKKSLQECNTESRVIWECFAYMASILRNMYLNGESNIEKAFHEQTGYELALGEGPATRQNASLMKLREDIYEGRTILAEPHLKKGSRDADPLSVRIYYAFDHITKKIVISYCSGRHLENASTRYV